MELPLECLNQLCLRGVSRITFACTACSCLLFPDGKDLSHGPPILLSIYAMLPGKPGAMSFTEVFSPGPKIKYNPQMCVHSSQERRTRCMNTRGERDRQDHLSRPLWVARQQASLETAQTGFLMGLGVTADAAEAAYKPQAPPLHSWLSQHRLGLTSVR